MPNTNKTIQQLNLEDDFLFAKVMSDKEVCRKVLKKYWAFPSGMFPYLPHRRPSIRFMTERASGLMYT